MRLAKSVRVRERTETLALHLVPQPLLVSIEYELPCINAVSLITVRSGDQCRIGLSPTYSRWFWIAEADPATCVRWSDQSWRPVHGCNHGRRRVGGSHDQRGE